MKIKSILALATVAFTLNVSAQLKTPQPSPTATISQTVGLTDVEVVYSRPGMKDRVVFGNLVAFDKVWRTGANGSTKINFSSDVTFGGIEVPQGKYALYTIPGKTTWTVILSKDLTLWGSAGYDEANDLGRFTVTPTKLNDKVESLTIDFNDFKSSSANMTLSWENTKITMPIETPTNAMVEKQIETVMAGPSTNDYFSAGRFYLEQNKNLDLALEYVNKAVEQRPEAFWMSHVQAKILMKLGKKKEALVAAEKSLTLAKENKDGDFGYVANNEKLIKEIKNMK